MRLLIFIVPLIAVGVACFYVGRASAKTHGPKLTRPEREELSALREFKTMMRITAMNHVELEPNIARIVLDEISTTERDIDNARSAD